MLRELIQENYCTIIVSLFLIIFIMTNRSFENKISKMFLFGIITVLILVVVDSIEMWTSTWVEPSILRILMSSIGYSIRPLVIFFVIAILIGGNRKALVIMEIPLIINAIISFSALITPVMYSYDENNQFVRGPIGYLPFVVSGCYLLIMVFVTIKRFKDGNILDSVITVVMCIISGLAIYLESAYKFGGILNCTMAVSISFYYLYLHTQHFKRDVLTGVFNRRCFYLDMNKLQNAEFAIISIDLNNLKTINDMHGHGAGDKAIRTMVYTIRHNLSRNATLYRTGGDEFMIIITNTTMDKTDELVSNIRRDMNKTKYSFAIGVSYHTIGEDVDDTCRAADISMYADKRAMKAE